MTKYCKRKIEECAEWIKENGLIDYGGAMMKDFCKAMDIEDETFYKWMKKKEFSDEIEKAKDYYRRNLEFDIVKSLAKSAKGFDTEEVVTEYVNDAQQKPVVKHQIRKKKHVPPNTGAAIFLLTNLNGDRWKNKQSKENDTKIIGFEQLMMELDKKDGGE